MKRRVIIAICFLLSSCATQTFNLVPEGKTAQATTTIAFDQAIRMSEIDGKPFTSAPTNPIAVTTTEVTLLPGVHTFKFRYSTVNSVYGGTYTKEDTVLSRDLEAGKKYRIWWAVKEDRRMSFKILLEGEPFL